MNNAKIKKSQLQFSDPVLKEFHIEINEDFLAKHSDEEMIDMPKVVYETDHTAIENNEFFVIGKVVVGEVGEDSPFYAYVTMGARFYYNEDISEELLNNFISVNAPAHILSYMRPVLAMLTSMTPFPSYHLPFLNLIENNK